MMGHLITPYIKKRMILMKKKNREVNVEIPQDSPSFSTAFEENSLIQWFSDNGKIVLFSFFGLIIAFLLIYRLAFGEMIKAETDFFHASQEYQVFSQHATTPADLEASNEALQRLQKIMGRHPELKAKYEGLIAQTLVNREEGQRSQSFGEEAIQRTLSENQPFFTQFSQNTLLIANHNYAQALQQSLELKEQLRTQSYPLLYGFNLLRIAALQQNLSFKEAELNTWQEWKQFVKNDDSVTKKLVNHFKDGNMSINNYIDARENILRIKN